MGGFPVNLSSFARKWTRIGAVWLLALGVNVPFALAETRQGDMAQFSDLRFGRHDEFCRVVLDTDAKVGFAADLAYAAPRLKLSGLAAPIRHEKLGLTCAPVAEVHLVPTGVGAAELSFVVTQSVVMRVSQYGANASGAHRLVVDLYFSEIIELSLPKDREQIRDDQRVRVIFADALKN